MNSKFLSERVCIACQSEFDRIEEFAAALVLNQKFLITLLETQQVDDQCGVKLESLESVTVIKTEGDREELLIINPALDDGLKDLRAPKDLIKRHKKKRKEKPAEDFPE